MYNYLVCTLWNNIPQIVQKNFPIRAILNQRQHSADTEINRSVIDEVADLDWTAQQ